MRLFATYILLITTACSLADAASEKLRHRLTDDGYRFFIENAYAESEQYSVDVVDIRSAERQSVLNVSGFEPSLMKGIQDRDFSAEPLQEGIYSLNLKRGDTVLSKSLRRLDWDNEYLAQTIHIDRRTSELRWKPSAPCLARIIAVLPSGMTVDVISGWKFYPAQEQAQAYDFIGDDGRDLRTQANLSIFAQYIVLPTDLLIVGQPDFADYSATPMFQKLELPRTPLYFELTTNAQLREGGEPIYLGEGKTSITVELSDATAEWLDGKRFEILIYLDGEFVHEEAQGVSPYTYILPDFGTTDKPQNVSVNILDYLGNWGTQTLTFQFLD